MVAVTVSSDSAIVKFYAYTAVQAWSFPPDRLSKPLLWIFGVVIYFMTERELTTKYDLS